MKKNAILFTIILFGIGTIFAQDPDKYSGGSGSSSDPFQIANLDDLIELSNAGAEFGAHFLQTADIDASASATLNGGAGFKPIGKIGESLFFGTYDGGGFSISNLTINRPAENEVGLFGYTNGATLKNIHLKASNIKGGSYVGGIVGNLWNGANVSNSSFENGTVEGNQRVGGIAGSVTAEPANLLTTKISTCFSTGAITGETFVGGITGYNTGYIFQNYSMASASPTSTFGGIGGVVGQNGSTGTISECYATGVVTGPSGYSGGVVGFNEVNPPGTSVTKSYWDTETSSITASAGGEGKTSAEMKLQSTYVDWDFTGTWKFLDDQNDGYPLLQWQAGTNTSIGNLKAHSKITLHPVRANIYSISVKNATSMEIYSVSGQLVGIRELKEGTNTLDLTGYINGVYIVNLQNKAFKLVKN